MKKTISLFLLSLAFLGKSQNLPISGLPAASAPSGTEVTVVVQGGVTKKMAISNVPITGKLIAGSNTTLTGSGTAVAPYTVTAGGGTPVNHFDSLRNTYTGQTAFPVGTNSTNFGNVANGFNCLATHTIGLYNIGIGFEALRLANASYECINLGWHSGYNSAGAGFQVGIGSGTLFDNVNGQYNIGIGYSALHSCLTDFNIGIGYANSYSTTTGTQNTSIGGMAFHDNKIGNSNASFGYGALQSNTLSTSNTALGANAMQNMINGNRNTASGKDAMGAGPGGVGGDDNTAHGYRAIYNITTGTGNGAYGSGALQANTTGNYNFAGGLAALGGNINGSSNHAIGFQSMLNNSSGNFNEAYGEQALYSNTIGSRNFASGYRALFANTTGNDNQAIGTLALGTNSTGVNNCGIGYEALFSNFDGTDNLAVGKLAQFTNVSGYQNIGIGFQSLYANTTNNNTAVGYKSFIDLTTGGGVGTNVGLGNFTGAGVTTGNGNLFLGYNTAAHAAGTTNNIELNSGNVNRYLFDGNTHNFVNAASTLSSLRVSGTSAKVDIGQQGTYGSLSLMGNAVTTTANNFALLSDGTDLYINAGSDSNVVAFYGGNNLNTLNLLAKQKTNQAAPNFNFLCNTRARTTAGALNPAVKIIQGVTGWYTGAIASNYGIQVTSPTWSAVASSNITNGYNVFIDDVTLGANMTITNKGALAINGNFASAGKSVFGPSAIATLPTAYVMLQAGTTAAGTAPVKYNSGPLMTTAEVGGEEFLTDKRYTTITTGAARKEYALFDIAGTSGRVPFETTNGRLTDLAAFTYVTNRLSPTYITLAAGTTAAGTAPEVLTTGTSLTTPIAGAIEYTTPQLFFTNGGLLRQEIALMQQSRVSSVFNATSNTTLANITGLTANVAAGKNYRIRAVLYTTSDATAGVKFAIGGTATATNIIYEGLAANGGLYTQTRGAAIAAVVCAVTAVTAAYVVIEGQITVNAAGTITVQFAQNVSNAISSTVAPGSNFQIQEML